MVVKGLNNSSSSSKKEVQRDNQRLNGVKNAEARKDGEERLMMVCQDLHVHGDILGQQLRPHIGCTSEIFPTFLSEKSVALSLPPNVRSPGVEDFIELPVKCPMFGSKHYIRF